MSKVESGSITITGTGSEVILLADDTLDIEKIVLFVGSSSTEASAGFTDLSEHFTGSPHYDEANDSNTITHLRNVSGLKTKVFEAKIPAGGFSSAGEFSLDVTTCTQVTQLKYVVIGS